VNLREMALPEGKAGQALAVGLTVLALALIWLGLAAPLAGWYGARADLLTLERQEIAHGAALARSLPALRQQAAAAAARADDNAILLAGGSDAIAGANLQAALQALAAQAGTSLDSVTMVPAQPQGTLRRIGVQVSLTATWPVLSALLGAIDTARPRMIVDQLTVTSPGQTDPRQDAPLQAAFTVAAFRTGPP
jgi:general secretion pathway protein M